MMPHTTGVESSSACLFTGWMEENNRLASEFHTAIAQRKDVQTFLSSFYELLQKLHSLPMRRENVGLELTVLYNCVYCELTLVKMIDSHHPGIQNTVNRVYRWVTDSRGPTASSVSSQLESIFSYKGVSKGDTTSDLLYDLLAVCVLYTVGLMKIGDLKTAQEVITQACTHVCSLNTHNKTTNIDKFQESQQNDQKHAVKLGLPSQDVSGEIVVSLSQVLSCTCLWENGRLEEILPFTQNTTDAKYMPLSVYFRALSHYDADNVSEALTVLQELKSQDVMSMADCLRARLHSLTGCCVAKVGRPHTAIQHFKQALEADFGYQLPLYFIALQYRQLNMETAELEAFNLLTTNLLDQSKKPMSSSYTVEEMVLLEVRRTLDKRRGVSLAEVQYVLASRCLQLQRYESAFEQYLDLLAFLMESDTLQPDGRLIHIPDLGQIFVEAVRACLQCNRFEECLTLCDQALSCLSDQCLLDDQDTCSCVYEQAACAPPATGLKRKRKDSHEETCEKGKSLDHLSQLLIHKAESQRQLGKIQEAITSLQSAVEYLEKVIVKDKANVQLNPRDKPVKRARLSAGCEEAPDTHLFPQSRLSQIYCKLGEIWTQEKKHTQAIHCYRLSQQLYPNNRTTVYQCTKELFSVNRVQEAVSTWLEYRNVSPKMDTFQISREIRSKHSSLKEIIERSESNEAEDLEMDIQVLTSLLRLREIKPC